MSNRQSRSYDVRLRSAILSPRKGKSQTAEKGIRRGMCRTENSALYPRILRWGAKWAELTSKALPCLLPFAYLCWSEHLTTGLAINMM